MNPCKCAKSFESVNPTGSTPKSADKHISIRRIRSWRVDETNLDITNDYFNEIPTVIISISVEKKVRAMNQWLHDQNYLETARHEYQSRMKRNKNTCAQFF